ncbi:MAG: ATP-binding protein [Actinomycetaceae bacterium]|nr:ATP-binding protein [Actinomycetaceae bacterium]
MFIGRERELSTLRNKYESGVFEFVGVYGRRRVGKTALLTEFTKDLPNGWCTAVEADAQANLVNLSKAVYSLQNPNAPLESAPVFADVSGALEAAFAATKKTRGVLVIDEFPYMAQADPSFSSTLQAAIDRHHAHSQLFLILCGSSLSFMKHQLFGKESPLYGRRTGQIELKPFDYWQARAFFPDMDATDSAALYAMTGGIPLYLRQFSPTASVEENISQVFLNPSSILYEEPANLLKQEVRDAAKYHKVMSVIAAGSSRHNEIATGSGVGSSALDYYLKELVELGLVSREEPVTGRGGRRAVWKIDDLLFRFWFRFIRPRQPLIDRGLAEGAASIIKDELPDYMGTVFEHMCRDWLWREYGEGRLDVDIVDIGRWWGNDSRKREEAEIDLVAVGNSGTSLIGECKWRNEPVGADVVERLDSRAWLVGADQQIPRYVFSREGFDSSCRSAAKDMGNVRLISFEEMKG